jgi:PPOX class probable F420-dependent enzyme
VLTNTMRGFQKEKNMRANPRVTLFVYDPRNPLRNIEVRGLVVEMTEVGAIEHDDELARLYLGKEDAHFFGDAVPARLLETYCPVKVAIAPFHVRVEEPGSTLPRSLQLEPPHIQAGFRPSPLTITPAPPGNQPVPIPASHQDLLVGRVHGVLSTMLPGGQPQSSLVWVDYEWSEGQPPRVLINTALERQKCRNMLANPRVTVLVVDPANTERWVEVRGRVTRITSEGATAHADKLTQRYAGKTHFYGDIYPVERRQSETRVIVEIEPDKITLDAIFR